jgi:hypothetical protein
MVSCMAEKSYSQRIAEILAGKEEPKLPETVMYEKFGDLEVFTNLEDGSKWYQCRGVGSTKPPMGIGRRFVIW